MPKKTIKQVPPQIALLAIAGFSLPLLLLMILLSSGRSAYPSNSNNPNRNVIVASSKANSEKIIIQNNLEFLVKSESLYDYFSIDENGVSMYRNREDKENNLPECRIFNEELSQIQELFKALPEDELLEWYLAKGNNKLSLENKTRFTPKGIIQEASNGNLPLSGKRIALDPGHFGGSDEMAELEGRLMKFLAKNGDTLKLKEGDLALATCLFLAEKLKKQGAEVLFTRQRSEFSSLGKTFKQWISEDFRQAVAVELEKGELTKKEADFLLKKATEKEIFNTFFKYLDFTKRAEIINQWQPDLTIIVHYNVDNKDYVNRHLRGDLTIPTDRNYCMAFVPGSFMKGELSEPRDRMHFLRLLVAENIERSVSLSQKVINQHDFILKVPPVLPSDNLLYLERGCIATQHNGVYARNLSLTRLIKGTICYGESLCTDNEFEYLSMGRTEVKLGELDAPLRAEEVAEAFLKGIIDFFEEEKAVL